MKCPTDSTELMAFLGDPDSSSELGIHLTQCQSCRERLARLRSLSFQPPDRLSCADAEPALLAWLESDASFALTPAVRQHLSGCPACQQTAIELRTLPRVLAQDRLAAPPELPSPDLAFLKKPSLSLPRWRQQMEQAVQHGAYWLMDRSGAVWLNLQLIMQWQPVLSPVAIKGDPSQAQPLAQVALTPEPDLNLGWWLGPTRPTATRFRLKLSCAAPVIFWMALPAPPLPSMRRENHGER